MRVWYVNAEDPLEETERRVEAILKHYGLRLSDLGDRLFRDSGRQHDCVFVKDAKNGIIATPVVEGVIEGIKALNIDVTILDPIVAFHRVPENGNGKMDAVMQELKDVADWTNTSVEIVGHTRKTDREEVKLDDLRAATSIVNAVPNIRLSMYMVTGVALFLVLLLTTLNTLGVSAGVRLLLTGLIIVAVITAAGGE
jgi:RecA-family ATPase